MRVVYMTRNCTKRAFHDHPSTSIDSAGIDLESWGSKIDVDVKLKLICWFFYIDNFIFYIQNSMWPLPTIIVSRVRGIHSMCVQYYIQIIYQVLYPAMSIVFIKTYIFIALEPSIDCPILLLLTFFCILKWPFQILILRWL
jgi:hypothetical protein